MFTVICRYGIIVLSLLLVIFKAQISKAIDSIRRKNFTDAKAQLELVKAEYDRANEQLFICDRTRFLTCNHATEKCGCGSGNGHKSASAGQQEATGYRFMPKSRIKSYFCYVTSGKPILRKKNAYIF